MSWTGSQVGGEAPAPYVEDHNTEKVLHLSWTAQLIVTRIFKVADYSGRAVANKSANRPYLAYVFTHRLFF